MPSESWSLQLAVIAQGKAIAQDRCGSSRLLVAASLSLGHPAICGVGRQTGAPALSPPTWSRPQPPHLCDSAFQTNLFGGGVEVKLQVLSSNFTKNSSISLVHQRQFSEMRKRKLDGNWFSGSQRKDTTMPLHLNLREKLLDATTEFDMCQTLLWELFAR